MNIPFLSGGGKRDQIFAVDFGTRTTKAVLMDRKGKDGALTLSKFLIQDAPIYDKALPQGLLTEHLRNIVEQIQPVTKRVTVAVGAVDSVLRSAELPLMQVSDMRQMLKFNAKNYLQQDLRDYVFDCYIVPPQGKMQAEAGKTGVPKYKVWVGGARQDFLNSLAGAIKAAGLVADQVTLTLLGPVNALEMAQPDVFNKETVALVDLGFKTTSISILCEGELCLSRSVEIGGDRFTTGLSEALGISYAEAEGIKIGMPAEVEAHLQPLVAPLGRELRASIDFFEHQREKNVSQVLISGGAARSEFIVQQLQSELVVSSKAWYPTSGITLNLPAQQLTEIEQSSSQLTVALGSAAATGGR
ncbi:MAG TPA: pilus assembly protein PilM [Verrucomicrobiae bacterium]|jgi:type IV pilus assembly protein PilM|nr:pilus assembly protein PilM [Verrucomicrobiae bacterium]